MKRYVLAPGAARDLVEIWRYIRKESSENLASRVERVIREKIVLLAGSQRAGHLRHDFTDADVGFFPVYSYLIVYRPDTTPLQVVAILHGARDVARLFETAALNRQTRSHFLAIRGDCGGNRLRGLKIGWSKLQLAAWL